MRSPEKHSELTLPMKYEPGWSVIIYDGDVKTDKMYAGLSNSELFFKEEIEYIIGEINAIGFYDVPFYYEEQKAKKLVKELRQCEIQCEVVYTNINEYNINKLKNFLLAKIAENINSFKELEKAEV